MIRIFLRIKVKVTHNYANRVIFIPTVKYFLTITTTTPNPMSLSFLSTEI